MATRYICKGDMLYYAMIVDGKYRKPVARQKFLVQPQYVILATKKGLYEVMPFTFYQTIQQPDYASPTYARQMFIPLTHIVQDGDPAPPLTDGFADNCEPV